MEQYLNILRFFLWGLAYTAGLINLILAFIGFLKKLIVKEELFFLISFIFIIISLNIMELLSETNSRILNYCGYLSLFGICGIIYSLPRMIISIYNITYKKKVKIVFTSIAIALFFMLLAAFAVVPKLSIYIVYLAYIFLSITVLYSMCIVLVHKKKDGVGKFKKIERICVLATISIVPALLFIDFFGFYIPFLRDYFKNSFNVLPVYYIFLNFLFIIINIYKLINSEQNNKFQIDLTKCDNYNISKRERDVLELLIKGISYKEIGETLFIALPTVKTHATKIYQKTGVKNRIELVHLFKI